MPPDRNLELGQELKTILAKVDPNLVTHSESEIRVIFHLLAGYQFFDGEPIKTSPTEIKQKVRSLVEYMHEHLKDRSIDPNKLRLEYKLIAKEEIDYAKDILLQGMRAVQEDDFLREPLTRDIRRIVRNDGRKKPNTKYSSKSASLATILDSYIVNEAGIWIGPNKKDCLDTKVIDIGDYLASGKILHREERASIHLAERVHAVEKTITQYGRTVLAGLKRRKHNLEEAVEQMESHENSDERMAYEQRVSVLYERFEDFKVKAFERLDNIQDMLDISSEHSKQYTKHLPKSYEKVQKVQHSIESWIKQNQPRTRPLTDKTPPENTKRIKPRYSLPVKVGIGIGIITALTVGSVLAYKSFAQEPTTYVPTSQEISSQ